MNNIRITRQRGFRKSLSTVTQLTKVVHSFSINNRPQAVVNFLDFSKAFDRVFHPILLLKLSSIFEAIIPLVYLSNRSQYVQINSESSPYVPVTSGVPQSQCLGHFFFFNTFINLQFPIKLFANDCIIYSGIATQEDQLNPNSVLQKIKE